MDKNELMRVIEENPALLEQANQMVGEQAEENNVERDSEETGKIGLMSALKELLSMPPVQNLVTLYVEKSNRNISIENYLKYGLAFTAIAIAGVLGYFGKMDSTMGVIIGSVMGYMFGQKNN